MQHDGRTAQSGNTHGRILTPLDAWALSLGCAVGWGAFVMPGSTLLPMAGSLGTMVAIVLGACAMGVIACCYHYMTQHTEGSGGAYTFTKQVFGFDHAFLCGWVIVFAYVAIIWANAASVVLIGRYLLGRVLQVGYCYRIGGYDVYVGEMLVTSAVLVTFGLLSCTSRRLILKVNTVAALVFLGGTAGCLALVVANGGARPAAFEPAFSSVGSPLSQIMSVLTLAPWAYVGYETVAHTADDLTAGRRSVGRALAYGLCASAFVYLATTVISVLATPERFADWSEYITQLGSLSGLEALPTFLAVQTAAGDWGLALLALTILCAISTSLIGLYRTVGKQLCIMAEDGILPERFATPNSKGVPQNAIVAIVVLSLFVPFVGRAAIGWIVDVTSVTASIAYCYVCLCAYRVASQRSNRSVKVVSVAGIVISLVFFFFPLIPSLWRVSTLASESYLILAAWAILGLFFFWINLRRDATGRFGKSTIVWIALLCLVFYASTMWVRQRSHATSVQVVSDVVLHYGREFERRGFRLTDQELVYEEQFINLETDKLSSSLLNSGLLQYSLLALSLWVLFNIFTLMSRRQAELDARRIAAEQTSQAKTMFLSNVSHDLRTPMNAIVGYTQLAKKPDLTYDELRSYIDKIDAASAYMLGLVNDVLEMGRIESGRLVLNLTSMDLCEAVDAMHDMFAIQMQEKGIRFAVDTSQVWQRYVLCDENHFNSILLNLLSNAYKFTPEGGQVSVTLAQLDGGAEGHGIYELHVRDTGIGMSPEFAQHVFEPFERERSATVSGIQGTGLGMSITKSIIDLMGATIDLTTEQGKGTEFVVRFDFELAEAPTEPPCDDEPLVAPESPSLEGKRVLLVDDNAINLEVASFILEDMGLIVSCATDGSEAVDLIREADAGAYDVVLMDVQMPTMDGYTATRSIRALDDHPLADVPIVAVTANSFAEDVEAAHAAGMDAHLAKPLDVDMVRDVLTKLIG